jgi:hypothetical protein
MSEQRPIQQNLVGGIRRHAIGDKADEHGFGHSPEKPIEGFCDTALCDDTSGAFVPLEERGIANTATVYFNDPDFSFFGLIVSMLPRFSEMYTPHLGHPGRDVQSPNRLG